MQSKVAAPAIGLLVVAILSGLFTLLGLFGGALNDWMLKMFENANLPPDQMEQIREAMAQNAAGNAMGYLFLAINIAAAVLIAVGALKMKSLESYGLAMTASILAMVPCIGTSSCCCVIGLPIGLWALIVLMDKDVKAAFGASTPPPL
jgi:hypothetical protein